MATLDTLQVGRVQGAGRFAPLKYPLQLKLPSGVMRKYRVVTLG
jgi:hypothetical protein